LPVLFALRPKTIRFGGGLACLGDLDRQLRLCGLGFAFSGFRFGRGFFGDGARGLRASRFWRSAPRRRPALRFSLSSAAGAIGLGLERGDSRLRPSGARPGLSRSAFSRAIAACRSFSCISACWRLMAIARASSARTTASRAMVITGFCPGFCC